jgi:hypothetical protein
MYTVLVFLTLDGLGIHGLTQLCSAGIFKQPMAARNLVGIGSARLNSLHGGIGSLESIFGLLKSLKIRDRFSNFVPRGKHLCM